LSGSGFFLLNQYNNFMEYKYTSIVLGKKDVGETDRIYFLYTLEGGKIQVLAKGVRKSGAKLAGLLENLTLADISIAKNQGIGKIISSVVENNFSSLRSDYYSLSKALFSINIFNHLIELDQKDLMIFDILREYLEALDSQSLISATLEVNQYEEKIELLTVVFLLKLLEILGYGREMSACVECGQNVSTENVAFSSKSGGLICEQCNRLLRAQLLLSANAIKLMRLASRGNIKSFGKLKVQKKDVDFVKMAIQEMLEWI